MSDTDDIPPLSPGYDFSDGSVVVVIKIENGKAEGIGYWKSETEFVRFDKNYRPEPIYPPIQYDYVHVWDEKPKWPRWWGDT